MRTRITRISFRKTIIADGSSITTPTAFWNLDQASGSSRTDSCSSPADLSVNGTVTQVTGKINYAANAASGLNYLSNVLASKLQTGGGSYSFAGWFKLDSAGGGTIAANGGSGTGWKLTASTTAITLTNYLDFVNFSTYTKTVSLSTGTWYFLCGYYDGANMGLSIDGATFTTNASTYAASNSSNMYLTGDFASGMQGALDEFGYWVGHVLTSTEKDNLYNSGNGKTFNGSSWV